MNANEVIARRAQELGGAGAPAIHPNDHVNLGQSSNDIAPTAFHVAAVVAIERELLPALRELQRALEAKAERFDGIVKTGRTHLCDATPIRLGQEFSGWASQVEHSVARVLAVLPDLRELAAGGTAVGTGLNTHPEFGRRLAAELTRTTGSSFAEARNHFEAQGARDAAAWASGAMNGLAASLFKIASDVLNPLVGYDRAAQVVRRAAEQHRPVRQVARELLDLDPAQIDRALDPRRQTEPGL